MYKFCVYSTQLITTDIVDISICLRKMLPITQHPSEGNERKNWREGRVKNIIILKILFNQKLDKQSMW